jgi:hypothetical protein
MDNKDTDNFYKGLTKLLAPFIEMVGQTNLPFMETVRVMVSVAK